MMESVWRELIPLYIFVMVITLLICYGVFTWLSREQSNIKNVLVFIYAIICELFSKVFKR